MKTKINGQQEWHTALSPMEAERQKEKRNLISFKAIVHDLISECASPVGSLVAAAR